MIWGVYKKMQSDRHLKEYHIILLETSWHNAPRNEVSVC